MIEFSPTGYAQLLQSIRDHGYQTVTFNDLNNRAPGIKYFLLRHDVDVNLDYAHEMAKREADFGVRSTYFVMLRSPFYNLWSRIASQLLREIAKMGHAIGLHFDAAFSQGPEKTRAEWIAFEAETLSALANTEVKAFSLHQPTPEAIDQRLQINGMINTYHPDHMKDFTYISDSNRDWRGKDPIALMKTGENIQLLAHPIWWMNANSDIEACWDDAINLNFQRVQEQVLATERAYGPERVLILKRKQ
jgi:hypothetical protein